MRPLEIGVALNSWRSNADPVQLGWRDLRDLTARAEAVGFDAVWFPDGLLAQAAPGGPVLGVWDAIAVLAAMASCTTRVRIGSWVLASLYRDPALTAKQAATIDEISGGRFVLGIGAGEASWSTRAFGYPDDHVYDRFEEALEILVPLLRAGRADFEGTHRRAHDLVLLPTGPRPGGIPILLAAHGPRGYRHAARRADVWSCYALGSGDAAEFGPRVRALEAACAEVGRDPATIGRSAGVVVAPLVADGASVATPWGTPVTGSAERIAAALLELREVGFTQVEVMLDPLTPAAIDAMGRVLEVLHRG